MHGRVGLTDEQVYAARDLPEPAAQPVETQVDLRAVLGLVRRHKWSILGTFVLVLSAAALITSQIAQRYTATALVVVDDRESQLLGFQSVAGGDAPVDTEVEIARSTAVLRRAADALDLVNAPEYAPRPSLVAMLTAIVGLGDARPVVRDRGATFASLDSAEQARIIAQLSRSLDIDRRGLTNIISLSATALSPADAARAANAVANAYLAEQIDAKLNANDRAAAFLRERVESLAKRIADGESRLDAFVTEKLQELGSPEAKALLTKLADEARKRASYGATIVDIQQALSKADYVRLAQLADAQEAGIAKRRQDLMSEVAAAESQTSLADATQKLRALDAEIRIAAEKRAADLGNDITLSNGVSAAFRSQVQSALTDVRLPPDISSELFRLQRDAEANRGLYGSSMTKLRQVEQQSDFKFPDSRVIASAVPPVEPSFPPFRLILAGAVLFGLGAGIGIAFLREHFIGGIVSVEQFEALLPMPVAAAVPRYAPPNGGRVDLAIVDQPLSVFSEAIRRVQLNIDVLSRERKRCILVTSPVPGDGKTTLALSLARQMAVSGNSVILIDADLRHPSVHKYVDAKVEGGLIDFLSSARGDAGTDQLAITREARTGLACVLGGDASAVATDTLLMSAAFDRLMKFARDNYDVVIVDTPPIGLVVDAVIVAQHCDAAIFTVRYAATSQRQVQIAGRELLQTKLPIYGVVNLVSASADAVFGYGHKYRGYYGGDA